MRISDWSSDVCSSDLRDFFEQNFHVYQVMSPAQDTTGKLTGYFEPLLDGSRRRDARFKYPVYGVPHDLYLLDSRRIDGDTAWLRLDGNRLKVASPGSDGAREYVLAIDDVGAGVRDKRYRVRSEEHKSELQSLLRISYAVFCLKKKK